MKRFVGGLAAVAALVGLFAVGGSAPASAFPGPCVGQTGSALAACQAAFRQGARRGYRRGGGTEVITTQPSGIDISTLMLLGAMGGGTGDLTSILPLLALQGSQQQTTVVERRGRRWRD